MKANQTAPKEQTPAVKKPASVSEKKEKPVTEKPTGGNPLQLQFNFYGEKLAKAFIIKKDMIASAKDLKKELKAQLKENSKFLELEKNEKQFKRMKADAMKELSEIKKQKEQIAMEMSESKEIENIVEGANEVFLAVKDEVIQGLSRDLANDGIVAEVGVDARGQLYMIIAK